MERHAVILVVDDDHEVRELGAELLMAEGHIVKQAADGQEALQILINDPTVEVLFTDIVMPGELDGWQLALAAKQIRPDLKVLYTTGFTRMLPAAEDAISHSLLMSKPWRIDQLLRTISVLLKSNDY